ncbi:MAG: ThuA domain-containing protein [Pirellulaceae bacterium]
MVIEPNASLDWSLTVVTNEDKRPRTLPLRRFALPWTADAAEATNSMEVKPIAELAGGNWGLGRRVFHSEAASCFKCHAINGAGPSLGPDLSNLVHRDYASVLRDIRHPSRAINPDFLGQVILLKDGKTLTGVVQTRDGELYVGDALGKVTRVPRHEIEAIKASDVSVMPTGIDEKLSAEQFRDLMTFLLTSPPHMPLDSPLQAPPLRTQAEVAEVLAGTQPLPADLKKLRIVLVAGSKDHGPGEHDYPAWQLQWGQLLAAAEQVQVEAAWDFPNPEQLNSADVLVFFQKGDWNDERQRQMDAYFERGGGGVYIHWAVNGNDRVADFSKRIGLASKGGSISFRHGPLALQVHNTDHPIMRNIEPLQLYDESYWRLTGETEDVTLFASSMEDGAPQPQLWAYERSAGRVFVSIPGHYNWTFDDPIFRTILLRGIAWTAHEPVDRFNDLVPLGARMSK